MSYDIDKTQTNIETVSLILSLESCKIYQTPIVQGKSLDLK